MKKRHLPHHLIVQEILHRLPVKSLIRFKSVSKPWFSTLSSPEFARLHLKFSSLYPKIILRRFDAINFRFGLLHYQQQGSINKLITDITPLRFNDSIAPTNTVFQPTILGSCNGLVCLSIIEESSRFFCLWNPASHQLRKIEYPAELSNICRNHSGFGYIPSIDDYVIVSVFYYNDQPFNSFKFDPNRPKYSSFWEINFSYKYSNNTSVYVYSSRTGRWKRMDDLVNEHDNIIEGRRWPLLMDDKVYLTCSLADWKLQKRVVGFNLVTDRVVEIPWMDWLDKYGGVNFYGKNGCLSMKCEMRDTWNVDIWTMEQPGDWNSWTKLFSGRHRRIHYMMDTRMCLVQRRNKQIKLLDLQQDEEEYQEGIDFKGELLSAHTHVVSLVSPFGYINEDED